MSSNWPLRKLSELTKSLNAKRVPVSSLERQKRQGPYRYYGASGVVDYVDDFLFNGTYLLVSEDGENLRTRNTPIAFKASGKYWVNNHAHILDETEPGVLDFLEHAFRLLDISPYITGAVQPKLNKRSLEQIELPVPDVDERLRVNNLLCSFDDKIELNRRMNEALEEMARALFRDWFVDFGPTRRQMEGATDPATIMGHAFPSEKATTLAPLFPAKLSDDGLPEGWSMGEVSDLADLNPKSWSTKHHPNFVEYVDLSNTKWGRIDETTNFTWKDAPSRARRVLEVGDTIVGTVRPGNGSYSLIGKSDLTGSTGFAVLRPKKLNFIEFVYCALTSPENIEKLANLADGGAYPAINPKVVAATKVALENGAVISEFSAVTQSIFAKRHANEQEDQTLASLRDLLLPKLMSGEIRLTDAEAAL